MSAPAPEDATLIVSQMQQEAVATTLEAFNDARRKMIAREDATWRLANRFEANPHLAYEAVTGTDKWFDDFTDEEIEDLGYLADDMAKAAIANCEGGQRIRELVAAGMAFGWYLAARKEVRAEEGPFGRPAPYLQGEFI